MCIWHCYSVTIEVFCLLIIIAQLSFLRKTWSLNQTLYSQNKASLDNCSLERFLYLQYTAFAVQFSHDAKKDDSFVSRISYQQSVYAVLILPPCGFLCPHSVFTFNVHIFWNVRRESTTLSLLPYASFCMRRFKTQTTCGNCLTSHNQIDLEFNIAVSSKYKEDPQEYSTIVH